MEKSSSGCYVIDSEYNVVNVNAVAKKLYPQLQVGKKCYACLMNLDVPCGPCPVANGVKGPTTYVDPIRHISEIVDAVEMDIPGRGRCYGLVFATVENEEQFAATLPTSEKELKNLALIKALTVDYNDVFSVDMDTDSMTLYRHDGKPVDADSVYKHSISYSEGAEDYIARYVLPEDREMMQEKCTLSYIRAALAETEVFIVRYRVLWKGELHYFFRKVARVGDAENFNHIVVGVGSEDREVLARQKAAALQDNLRKVEYNSMTNLLNKEAFFVHCEELLKRYPDTDFDLTLMRLDNLSGVNLQFGRKTGDRIIALVGKSLKTYEKDSTCLGYFGDGVFVSLTENTPSEERTAAIYAFRNDILEKSEVKNISMKWSVYKSIPRDQAVAEIYEKTAYAFFTVRGRMNQEYVEFAKDLLDRLDWDRMVEQNFKTALKDGEFVAWFQPKYSVATQKIVGAEALVRWLRPNGEIVPPVKFIPVLETSGLINLLDREVFRQACRAQQMIAQLGLKQIPISVNLSRASIYKNDIAQDYQNIARSFGVNPSCVPIEITESAAVRAIKIREFADSLVEKGFSLHMDDFGSGYSSLVSLQTLPFESIKLDKSLADFIGKAGGESLLRHTIAFARENGMSVVAEGVENAQQFAFLKDAGCDAIQGYYFSKPVTLEDFLKALH